MSTMKRMTDQNLVEFGAVSESDVVVQRRRRGGCQAGQEGQEGQEQEGEGVGP